MSCPSENAAHTATPYLKMGRAHATVTMEPVASLARRR